MIESVTVQGATAIDQDRIAEAYQEFTGREVPLSTLWEISARITQMYREEGYFLSRAYVPAQQIAGGHVTIAVVEGYVGAVEVEGDLAGNAIVQDLAARITEQRPARIDLVESTLLRLNDIPGVGFAGILAADDSLEEGATALVLRQADTPARGAVSLDNYGSRYTGPQQIGFAYEMSIAPFHKTSIAGLMTVPDTKESRSLTLAHEVRLSPEWSFKTDIAGSTTEPGYTLEPLDIDGSSVT